MCRLNTENINPPEHNIEPAWVYGIAVQLRVNAKKPEFVLFAAFGKLEMPWISESQCLVLFCFAFWSLLLKMLLTPFTCMYIHQLREFLCTYHVHVQDVQFCFQDHLKVIFDKLVQQAQHVDDVNDSKNMLYTELTIDITITVQIGSTSTGIHRGDSWSD